MIKARDINKAKEMIQRIHITEYLEHLHKAPGKLPLIDVRTPAEYEQGHIPGAVNIPLFSNEERAEVGTIYKQVSPNKAYDVAYKFVEPKLDDFVRQARRVASSRNAAVYCWRGGMRSRSFAEHLAGSGFTGIKVIEDGYKGFRRHALESFDAESGLVVLGGYTGSGKSRLLELMKREGHQVIDLEQLAHHRGSAFGGIGQAPQPTTEHFANLLYWEWRLLDHSKPIWVEDESMNIGKVNLPENFFKKLREVNVYFLDIPREQRAEFLVKEYAGLDSGKLAAAIGRISKRLGGVRTKESLEALERGDYYTTALITLEYYDKTYLKGLRQRDRSGVIVIESDKVDAAENARLLLQHFQHT